MTDTSRAKPQAIAPGRLRNWVEMTIQTRQAQRLVRGRQGGDGKPPIIGLYRYGAMTRTLWSAASKDDPYADWHLLQVEQTLIESKEEVSHQRQVIERDLERVSAMKVGLAQSLEPTKIELTFSNPYGYMGAWLLIDMDELALATLTARHVGLLKRDAAERLLYDAGRAVRRAFAAPQNYQFTAVTRKDVVEGNRKAQRAKQKMGDLPQDVIDGKLRPEHAPAIGRPEQSTGGEEGGDTADNENETDHSVAEETKSYGDSDDATR